MIISLIAAMGKNRLIGIDNQLPWHLPADLKHFKQLTTHKPIIMGRKTYESIGKPLPNRTNIILTQQKEYQQSGCLIAHSPQQAIDLAMEAMPRENGSTESEIMIIGGATIYKEFFPLASRMYLTQVDYDKDGDAYFPAWDDAHWQEVSREAHQVDEKNPFAYTFITYENKGTKA